jgi:hypothetical protein
VQHALRAFSPADQKTVRAAADTFRANPKLNTATVITEMKVGEALVSMLEAGGTPAMVDRIRVCPPRSRIGPITPEERAGLMRSSPVAGKYDQALDRESAYEKLSGRAEEPASEKAKPPAAPTGAGGVLTNILVGDGKRQGVAETLAKSVMRGVGSQVGTKLGRAVFRGVLGSLLK